jgi:hypothetical protein
MPASVGLEANRGLLTIFSDALHYDVKPCRAPLVAGLQRTAMENTPLNDGWAPPGEMKYLVVQGTNDQIAPPENGKLLKEELGARVTTLLTDSRTLPSLFVVL